MAATQSYPVRVDASLDVPLSRWLWLVKWVLVIRRPARSPRAYPRRQAQRLRRSPSLQVKVAATLPALPWIATGLLIGGIIFLIGGILLIAIPLRRTSIR